MIDSIKTKKQLIEELKDLRRQVADLKNGSAQKSNTAIPIDKHDDITPGDSEEYYRLIAENTTDFISITSFDLDATFLYVSPSYKTYLGYTSEELVGTSSVDFVHPDDRYRLIPILKRYIVEKAKRVFVNSKSPISEKFEFRLKDKSGSWHDLECTANLVGDKMLFVSKDISDKKQALRALQDSEEYLQNFMESSIEGFAILDEKLNFIHCNDTGARIIGLDNSRQIIGKHVAEISPNVKSSGRYDMYMNVMRTGEPAEVYDSITHPSKGVLHLHLQAFKLTGGLGIIIDDITESKNAAKELEKNSIIINSTTDPVITTDLNGTVTAWNRGAELIYDYSSDEMIGQPVAKLWREKDIPKLESIISDLMTGKDIINFEGICLGKRGNEVSILLSLNAIKDEKGTITELVGITKDITERKFVEEELKQSKETAERYLNVAAEIIISLNAEGNITMLNESGHNILGYENGDLIGKNWFDTCVPESIRNDIKVVFKKLIQGEIEPVKTYENPIITKDGSEKIILWHNSLLKDKKGVIYGTLSSGEDITERKLAEKALSESEQFNRAVIENSPLGISVRNRNGKLLSVNKAWQEIWHIPEETLQEYLDTDSKELKFDKRDSYLSKWQSDVEKVYREGGKLYIPEIRLDNHRSGEPRWVSQMFYAINDEHDNVDRVVIITNDITERKLAEERITEQQYLFEKAQEIGTMGTWELDISKNKLIWTDVNFRIFGIPIGTELNYDVFLEQIHPDDREHVHEEWMAALEGKPYDIEHRLIVDGKIKWVREKADIRFNKNNQAVHAIGFTQDITKHKQSEEELRESREALAHAQEIAHFGSWKVDLQGVSISASDEFYRIFGYKPQEIKLTRELMQNMIHPDDLGSLASVKESMLKGETVDFEYRIVRTDGSVRNAWTRSKAEFNSSGIPISLVGTTMDITKRKQAEEALQINEKKYSTLFENMMDGFALHEIILDDNNKPIDYKFIEVNDAFEVQTGVKKDEVIGKTITEILPGIENDQANWIGVYGKVALGRKDIRFEKYSELLDRWYNVSAFSPKKNYFATIFTDITERKRIEEALRESEQFNKAVIDNSPLGISVRNRYGKLLSVNKAWKDIWEIPEETLGKYMAADPNKLKFNGNDSYTGEWQAKIEKVYKEGGTLHIPDRLMKNHRTGMPIWVSHTYYAINDEKGDVDRMVIVTNDITERKRAEEALRESEERFRDLAEMLPEAVFETDSEINLTFANRCAQELFGYDNEDIKRGVNGFDLIADESIDLAKVNLGRRLKGEDPGIAEYRAIKIDGTTFPALFHISSILNEQEFVGLRGIIVDVTETKRLQALESRAERLETAGTIAGQVAHDFNNLLAPLMAYPEFIREELPHDHKTHAYLDDIEAAARKIADINQDLLTMGRRGHYNQEVLDINRLVLQTAKEMESRSRTVSIQTNLCKDIKKIKGGNAQLHRLLTNLLVNSQDAMQNIGQITIKTENYYAEDTSIAFGRVPKGEYVKLTISDNGCGIPDDIIHNILDPFFTTKTTDKKRGSGLGLSVVDAVMKDHNGYLDLKSQVGHGTTFYLYFPTTIEDYSGVEFQHSGSGEESILIVDDDDIQREVTTRLLTKIGYKASSIESGEKAIEFVKENPQDLIILDMVMPGGIDGADTYRQLLDICPDQKAIILSGFSESDRVLEAQKLGAGAFIKKPVTKKTIAAAVRGELDRKVDECSDSIH